MHARRAGCYDKMLFDAVTTHVATHFTKYETEQLLKVRAPWGHPLARVPAPASVCPQASLPCANTHLG